MMFPDTDLLSGLFLPSRTGLFLDSAEGQASRKRLSLKEGFPTRVWK
jgi:hypothetical protein